MSARQLKLFKPSRLEHGGDVLKGKRKEMRPFSPKASIHIVLRSSRARGPWSMLHRRNRSRVERTIYGFASANHVRVYRFANVGNHLHLLVRTPSPEGLQRFLKTVGGIIPRLITRARKGSRVGKFWDGL